MKISNNKRRLKVSWCSNSAHSMSGYGQQTADIGRMFAESGWDATNFSFIDMFGLSGGIVREDDLPFKHYPIMDHTVGSDAMVHHGNNFQSDIVISLFDIWPQNPYDLQQIKRWVPWAPIDYDPMPMPIASNLRFANRIISMSRFGEKQLRDRGLASTYIPHHVDTKIFFPMDKKKAKMDARIDPNTFVFGMVAANKDIFPRKSFQQVLEAFAQFQRIHQNSILYIHTNPEQPGGFPIKNYAEFLGISANVVYPDRYRWNFLTTKQDMNSIYNICDVYLAPSSSEGFCIPIIEAQAAGTPVIINDWTSMPELIIDGKTGLKTEIGCKHFMPIGSYMAWPNANDLYQKMERIFISNRVDMGREARKFVEKKYSLEKVWETRWLPFLTKIEEEIYGKQSLTIPAQTE